jgi:hypothetical protein
MRHAFGYHNRPGVINKLTLKDAKLDPVGIDQSERAGLFLKGFINNNYITPKIYYMASHLIRTQQTVSVVMINMNKNQEIYIVPCTHELYYTSDGDCDASLIQYITPPPNSPNCTSDMCPVLKDFSEVKKYDNMEIKLNWKYYMEFEKSGKKCSETNMLAEIINVFYSRSE